MYTRAATVDMKEKFCHHLLFVMGHCTSLLQPQCLGWVLIAATSDRFTIGVHQVMWNNMYKSLDVVGETENKCMRYYYMATLEGMFTTELNNMET